MENIICPNYTGDNHYIQQSAITDGKLFIATGMGSLKFTVNVLNTGCFISRSIRHLV